MKQALGLVEIQGLSTAFVVADTMAKAANVRILEIENTRGLGYMTIKVDGNVGAVTAAVNAGKQVGTEYQKLVSWKVIPRPSDYVEHTFADPDGPGSVCPPGYRERRQPDKPQVSPEEVAAAKTEPAPQEVKEAAGTEPAAEEVLKKVPEAIETVPEMAEAAPEVIRPQPEVTVTEAEVLEAVPEVVDVPEVTASPESTPETAEKTPEPAAEEVPEPDAPEKSKAAPRKKASSSAKGTAGDKTGTTRRKK